MLGLFHWTLGETSLTSPRGSMTMHVSVCEVPATPDSFPDTLTTGASTTRKECNIIIAGSCEDELVP